MQTLGDHPRSRGVYHSITSSPRWSTGSSPLARGLRAHALTLSYHRRIIPARAGFTVISGPGSARPMDHPRSRGVYDKDTRVFLDNTGSSPLARGLRRVHIPSDSGGGIIPARAGFTAEAPMNPSACQDHPRSRGVYVSLNIWNSSSYGSSPLARGLRQVRSAGFAKFGIIPARAGFTRRSSWPRYRCPDHPRSRGVYAGVVTSSTPAAGSSPLARGLPSHDPRGHYWWGIIPARAGFTTSQ